MQQMTEEGSVLQCQGELTKKISFKPSNVLSKAHRTLTLAVRKRAVKGSRIKKYAETIDPEQVRTSYGAPFAGPFLASAIFHVNTWERGQNW